MNGFSLQSAHNEISLFAEAASTTALETVEAAVARVEELCTTAQVEADEVEV